MKKKLHFAFAIFKYFPFGGLQGDMLRFAEAAAAKGINVTIFCDKWEGEKPAQPQISVRTLPVKGWSNHARSKSYAKLFHKAVQQEKFDVTFAFNRIGGCDYYFAADNCLAKLASEKHSKLALKLLPRYRTFLRQEKDIFAPDSKTVIFTISPHQEPDYVHFYKTPRERFIALPPGVRPECRYPGREKAEAIRKEIRGKLNIPQDAVLLITVGANLALKGGDRAAAAMKQLPANTVLLLVGNTSQEIKDAAAQMPGRILCPGPQKDIPQLLFASDLMIHPARVDATGSVLLEAVAAGLPVVASACCGFSRQMREAGMPVIPEPFAPEALLECIKTALANLPELQKKSLEYAASRDIFGRYDQGITVIQQAMLP